METPNLEIFPRIFNLMFLIGVKATPRKSLFFQLPFSSMLKNGNFISPFFLFNKPGLTVCFVNRPDYIVCSVSV